MQGPWVSPPPAEGRAEGREPQPDMELENGGTLASEATSELGSALVESAGSSPFSISVGMESSFQDAAIESASSAPSTVLTEFTECTKHRAEALKRYAHRGTEVPCAPSTMRTEAPPAPRQASSQHECKGTAVDSEELFQNHTRVSDTEAYLTVGERLKMNELCGVTTYIPRQVGLRTSLHRGAYRQVLSYKGLQPGLRNIALGFLIALK
ncbi:UNVERIFIED_CONTAM: hypothetical protein FKN15_058899 [Acipenser sinensis]